jgi:DNA-binding NarL/FixJ family response regulator
VIIGRNARQRQINMKILLVDDHALFVAGLAGILQANNFEVIGTAGDGFEALEKVRLLSPDVVLMDDAMPRCSGIEGTRMIKAEFPQVKVVMLATSDDDAALLEAIKNGASGYLPKSTGVKEFLQLLAGVAYGEAAITQKMATRIMGAFADSAQRAAGPSSKRGAPGTRNDHGCQELSPRQVEVLRLIAEGDTYKEIAARLAISERTVNYHMAEILDKLQLENRAQAIAYATYHGLIDANDANGTHNQAAQRLPEKSPISRTHVTGYPILVRR